MWLAGGIINTLCVEKPPAQFMSVFSRAISLWPELGGGEETD
jgi:hypothetical protein